MWAGEDVHAYIIPPGASDQQAAPPVLRLQIGDQLLAFLPCAAALAFAPGSIFGYEAQSVNLLLCGDEFALGGTGEQRVVSRRLRYEIGGYSAAAYLQHVQTLFAFRLKILHQRVKALGNLVGLGVLRQELLSLVLSVEKGMRERKQGV